MTDDWYTVQPRFGDTPKDNILDIPETVLPKKIGFFQKYKIYIIIMVVIIVLLLIIVFVFYFQKPAKPLITEKVKEPLNIDINEMKKLRDLRRQKREMQHEFERNEFEIQNDFVMQNIDVVFIDPIAPRYNTNKIEVLEDDNTSTDRLSCSEQEHQKILQKDLEYKLFMQAPRQIKKEISDVTLTDALTDATLDTSTDALTDATLDALTDASTDVLTDVTLDALTDTSTDALTDTSTVALTASTVALTASTDTTKHVHFKQEDNESIVVDISDDLDLLINKSESHI